jgi:uncharacterized YigZ family protein
MNPDTFLTIQAPCFGEYREKGSRFLAEIYPVTTVLEIKSRIALTRKEHPKAVHHCYAYRLGADLKEYRFSDDREPSGSAGQPIFGVIQSNGLTDTLIIVIRYFGGKQLGIPGLINAYRTAAANGIAAGQIEERKVMINLRLSFPEMLVNPVLQIIKKKHGLVLGFEPGATSSVDCSLGLKEANTIIASMNSEMPFINQVQIQKL